MLLSVPTYLVLAGLSSNDSKQKSIGNMTTIVFHYLLRGGEYTFVNPKQRRGTTQFRVCNVILWHKNTILPHSLPIEINYFDCSNAFLDNTSNCPAFIDRASIDTAFLDGISIDGTTNNSVDSFIGFDNNGGNVGSNNGGSNNGGADANANANDNAWDDDSDNANDTVGENATGSNLGYSIHDKCSTYLLMKMKQKNWNIKWIIGLEVQS